MSLADRFNKFLTDCDEENIFKSKHFTVLKQGLIVLSVISHGAYMASFCSCYIDYLVLFNNRMFCSAIKENVQLDLFSLKFQNKSAQRQITLLS